MRHCPRPLEINGCLETQISELIGSVPLSVNARTRVDGVRVVCLLLVRGGGVVSGHVQLLRHRLSVGGHCEVVWTVRIYLSRLPSSLLCVLRSLSV